MLLIWFFVILCGHLTRSQDDSPYTVEIDNFEISTEYGHKYVNWDTLGLKRKGRNKFVLSGTLLLNRNLANEQKINVQVYPYNKEKQAKGPIVFNLQEGICKFIAEDKNTYPGLMEKSNFPEPGTCPIPKNEYTIDDYELNVNFLPDNIRRGDYLLVFLMRDGMSAVAGFTATITITD